MAVTIDMMEYNSDENCQAAYVSSSIVPSPVSQWKMNDNAATTVVIDSVGSNTGTSVQNTDQLDTTGKINGALTFNGSSDTISITHSSSLKPSSTVSISAWVKPDDITTNLTYEIYRKEDVDNRLLFSFQEHGTVLSFGLYIGGSYAELDASITSTDYTDGWHHVVAVYDGSYKRIYRDGVQIDSVAVTGVLDTTGTVNAYIGSGAAAGEWFDGAIDDVRFYDFGLSLAEVAILYNSGSGTEDENPFSLQSYSESTIKTQGTYSLKGVAVKTDSLNDTLTKNIRLKATGGTITYDGDYVIHTFLSDGTFTPTSAFNVETLVVAGGGGGGSKRGGGGGAGGLLYDAEHAVTAKAYSITVGDGGTAATAGSNDAGTGEDSVFDDKTADGGGAGGGYNGDGRDGGCGGGGGSGEGEAHDGGTGSQGYNGGSAVNHGGGGGGGMGAVGANHDGGDGDAGGVGLDYSTEFGTSVGESGWFSGGGGGGEQGTGNAGGAGGTGGGGAGGDGVGTAGTANTGGGAGGSGDNSGYTGAVGGSGIVIIKYLSASLDLTDQELIKLDARSSETGKTIEATFADSDVKLILNGDGVDGSKEILDSGNTGHIITQVATAKLSTAQKRIGSTSLDMTASSGDFLVTPDSDDFYYGTDPVTIDFWVRFVAIDAGRYLYYHYKDTSNRIQFWLLTGGDLFFLSTDGGVEKARYEWATGLGVDTWYHIALVRNGTDLKLYVDGVEETDVTVTTAIGTNALPNVDDELNPVGRTTPNCYVDEYRVSKGIARWTSAFTPEVTPYTSDAYTVLLLHMNTQDESYASHIPTFVGTAQLDVAQYKYGTASYLFDGNSDYLTLPDSVDFSPGTGAFTIDFWIRPHDVSTAYLTVVDMRVGDNNTLNDLAFGTSWEASGYPYIYGMGETPLPTLFATKLTVDTWYHIAIIGNGGADGSRTIKGYLDGVLADGGSVTANYNLNLGKLRIGAMVATSLFYNGHIDGFRITKGRALWTANFTAPAVAPQSVISHIIDIASADTFQTESIDIADIANIDKENIDKVQFKIINADA